MEQFSLAKLNLSKKLQFLKVFVLLFGIANLVQSCVAHRDLVSFNEANIPDGLQEAVENAQTLKIQPNDLIRITVNSSDIAAAAPFNLEPPTANTGAGGGGGGGVQLQMIDLFSGYYVDQTGAIDFPILGRIPVEGKTLEDVKLDIKKRLEIYLKGPVVNVRFLNFKVTMLGSVAQPGVLRVTNQRITLLEAFAQVGGLTDYANRDSILVVREQDGRREYKYINLHSEEVFTSKYYYLEQNDFIYVPPIKARAATVADRGQRVLQYTSAILSVAAIVVAIILN